MARLRGTTGAEFEGMAYITHQNISDGTEGWCCSFVNHTSKEKEYILLKGPFCFVFPSSTSPTPKYAILLQNLLAKQQLQHGNCLSANVNLESVLGDVDYVLHFDTVEMALAFATAATTQQREAMTTEARKRLGHENLIRARASLLYAEKIAQQYEASQASSSFHGTALPVAKLLTTP
jgi:hypothetical protein